MQPFKIGQNTKSIITKFGELAAQQTGLTVMPLFYTSVIDQLKTKPNNHIAKILARSTVYSGACGFGTHIEIEFLSYDGYVLGKLQNVDKEREVVTNWIGRNRMSIDRGYPKEVDVYQLKPEEAVVGVEIGISKISEEH